MLSLYTQAAGMFLSEHELCAAGCWLITTV